MWEKGKNVENEQTRNNRKKENVRSRKVKMMKE